jgi:hypothetical protein
MIGHDLPCICCIYIHLITCKMQIVHTGDRLLTTDCDSGKRQTRPLIRVLSTSTNPQLSDSNKDLVLSPRWVLCSKTHWPTDVGRNIRIRLTIQGDSRVEAGSNTSTVALWVVGGGEKRSLKSETVKYGRKSHGTRTQKLLRWRAPAAVLNDRFVLPSERAPHINKPSYVW